MAKKKEQASSKADEKVEARAAVKVKDPLKDLETVAVKPVKAKKKVKKVTKTRLKNKK